MKKSNLLFLCISLIFILTGCSFNNFTIERNWSLKLPKDLHETYHKDTGSSFHGDGTFYTIYQINDTDSMESLVDWTDVPSPTRLTDSYEDFAIQCLDELDVPSDERINLEQCQYYYQVKDDGSELLLAYNPKTDYLYVIENRI